MTKKLSVFLHNDCVGELEQLSTGKLRFRYHFDAVQPISFSMPLQEAYYDHAVCEAYFGGLLPESETVKKIIANQYHISAKNIFSLLRAIGHDCAGAISFYENANDEDSRTFHYQEGKIIDTETLYQHIKALPKKPLFMGFSEFRLSLAGVHDKAAVCLIDDEIALPSIRCPTTYILKPSTTAFENLCANEFMCMQLAKAVGIIVPKVELRHIKDIDFLLIERYDRKIENKQVLRIHQEDFCQALSVNPDHKYQNEGGPGFLNCFDLLEKTSLPVKDRNALAARMVFNFLIGNCDAHGKNFSLLYTKKNYVEFAPAYDLISTLYYDDISNKMAMKIDTQYAIHRVHLQHWKAMCDAVQYRFVEIKKMVLHQSDGLLAALEKNAAYYNEVTQRPEFVTKFTQLLQKRLHKIIEQFLK